MSRAALGLALLAAAATGCSTLGSWRSAPALPACPGALLDSGELGLVQLRQRVRVRGPGVDFGFELAAETRDGALVLAAFTGFGAKAFTAVQRGHSVESRSFLGPGLPVPPRNVLRDLHYAWLLGARPPPGSDGIARDLRAGLEIRERWGDGRLRERSLRSAADPGAPIVRVELTGGDGSPRRARVLDPACASEMVFVELSAAGNAPSPAGAAP